MRKRIFDHYEIDSDGYVINLKNNCTIKSNYNQRNPYTKLHLNINNKKTTLYLHKLMVEAFVDKYDESIHTIRFADNNKNNCKLSNLMISTTKWLDGGNAVYVEPIIIVDCKI